MAITPEELAQAQEVFDHWQLQMGHTRTKLTKERLTKIVARLHSGFSVAQLKLVIDTVKGMPWWRGQNNRNKAYDDIVNIFRNDTRTESFLLNTQSSRTDTSLASTETDEHHYHEF